MLRDCGISGYPYIYFRHCLPIIFSSFCASGRLCFVIVAFPGILTYTFVIVCLSSFLLSVPREGCVL